jgi:hypothetical protein
MCVYLPRVCLAINLTFIMVGLCLLPHILYSDSMYPFWLSLNSQAVLSFPSKSRKSNFPDTVDIVGQQCQLCLLWYVCSPCAVTSICTKYNSITYLLIVFQPETQVSIWILLNICHIVNWCACLYHSAPYRRTWWYLLCVNIKMAAAKCSGQIEDLFSGYTSFLDVLVTQQHEIQPEWVV